MNAKPGIARQPENPAESTSATKRFFGVFKYTKKLTPDQIRVYKTEWEQACQNDFVTLCRRRFSFYYSMYKNPPRLLEAYTSLTHLERTDAVRRIESHLRNEQPAKGADGLFSFAGAVPQTDTATLEALRSVAKGEMYPSYLGRVEPHPADPSYSTDMSTQDAMVAYHKYDLWCQVVAQTLAEARGTIPIEDLFKFDTEKEISALAARLVSFDLPFYGKQLLPPRAWKRQPVGSLQAPIKVGQRVFRVKMQVRNMYLFSDTASVNLRQRSRAAGLGILVGANKHKTSEIELMVVPLLIGSGGLNFPK